MNYRLIFQALVGDYSLTYRLTLISNLLKGAWTAFSKIDFALLSLISVLVGLNLLLIVIIKLESQKDRLSISVGENAILGIVVRCSSCGFSVLSLLGLSASLFFIPFGEMELHLLAIILLLFSFFMH